MRRVRYEFTWRAAHAAALLVLWTAAAVVLGWRWAHRPIHLGQTLPTLPQRVGAVTERINPNTAPVGSLLRLRGIGPVKAHAIADYAAAHGPAAFRRAEDLTAVSGIGPSTAERLQGYLVFPDSDN